MLPSVVCLTKSSNVMYEVFGFNWVFTDLKYSTVYAFSPFFLE